MFRSESGIFAAAAGVILSAALAANVAAQAATATITQNGPVGVIVSWDGDTQTVAPGSCFMLDARKLSVRPAGPLGGNITLSGNIRVLR